MALPNIFNQDISEKVIHRVNLLTEGATPLWGKMDVSQMMAHCNGVYEMAYEDNHPKPNFLMTFMLKAFVKNIVTSEKPYKKNSRTAPGLLIKEEKDFKLEKDRLINYIIKSRKIGEDSFDDKISLSFGRLSKTEWNNMFYKHLNHHLVQFGV